MGTAQFPACLPHLVISALPHRTNLCTSRLRLNLIPTLVCMITLPCRITLPMWRPFSPVSLHLACNNTTMSAWSSHGRYGRRYRRYSGQPVCRRCCRAASSTVGRGGAAVQYGGGRPAVFHRLPTTFYSHSMSPPLVQICYGCCKWTLSSSLSVRWRLSSEHSARCVDCVYTDVQMLCRLWAWCLTPTAPPLTAGQRGGRPPPRCSDGRQLPGRHHSRALSSYIPPLCLPH